MATRNEGAYLANCLDNLIEQGTRYFLVDNDSDDGSIEFIRREPRYAKHLAGVRRYPFAGTFEWDGILRAIEDAAAALRPDWVILSAPDEILHPLTDETLLEAISRLDKEGFNVINFHEFVFLPIDRDYVVGQPGAQPLQWYYFHQLRPNQQMRARRGSLDVTWRGTGGHGVKGDQVRLATECFALRHYIFRSQEHAYAKYRARRFNSEELKRNWHNDRNAQPIDRFAFPDKSELEFLSDPASRALSTARPRTVHYWKWPMPQPGDQVATGSSPADLKTSS